MTNIQSGPDNKSSDKRLLKALRYPIDIETILRKRRLLKRELLNQEDLLPIRIAVLGGSTTVEVTSMLELFLLTHKIKPCFYESGYNAYSENIVSRNQTLWNFKPEIVYIHTTWQNVSQFPDLLESENDTDRRFRFEMARFESLWERIHVELGALIIQNNFDFPNLKPLGNLESSAAFGRVNFLSRLNSGFAEYARRHSHFLINDIQYLSSQVGLATWFDPTYWYCFHMAVSPIGTAALARNVARIVKSVFGKSKKCLVLDLDNTLWGGVIGDDGVQNLILGRDHPVGEAFVDFQRYVKDLQRRGVLLAICSKNDPASAKEGFMHPDSILKLEDFSAFKANWNPKPVNLKEIASDLNIGLDSMVFVDDNPAERALVADQLPEVAVPELGKSVSKFASALEEEGYFEIQNIVLDDLNRASYYSSNAQRSAAQTNSADYREFLVSLEMTADIGPFVPVYLERITQLINKTNQFNLTTRRLSGTEVEAIYHDSSYLTLYGRLADRFGDNGLVSIIIGRVTGDMIEIDLWLMSCRVFNRDMELAMFDSLVEECQARGIREIIGVYIPSKRNSIVADHYGKLGFSRTGNMTDGRELWHFCVPQNYRLRCFSIRRTKEVSPLVTHE